MLCGCGGPAEGVRTNRTEGAGAAAAVLIPVEAHRPDVGDIFAYFETTTRVDAEVRVEVLSKGSGECLEVLAEEGDHIQADQVLARLATKELEAQIRQSRVSVDQTRFQMETAEEQLREGILSPFEARNARFAHEQALATLRMQEIQLEYQTIRAPISGVVTLRGIQTGQVVASGMPVFRIVDPASYILPIMPPEKELPRLALGQSAKVTIDSVQDREFIAHVRRINPSVDPMSGTVKVVLDFEPEARPFLREGSFARVKLIMETRGDVILVPKDAVLEESARKYLMIIEEAPAEAPDGDVADGGESKEVSGAPAEPRLVARRVEIKVGLEDSNFVEVMEGIGRDTLVVTLGQHTLKPNTAVRITTAEEEIDSLARKQEEKAAESERRASGGGASV
jgi:membrane fusion protein (multidrug efflux system)